MHGRLMLIEREIMGVARTQLYIQLRMALIIRFFFLFVYSICKMDWWISVVRKKYYFERTNGFCILDAII